MKLKINIKKIITYTIILITLVFTIIIPIYEYFNKTFSNNENITTKLNNDTDFLNWFIDFDKLYRKKTSFINYSLKKESFEIVNKILTEEKKDDNTYFKNGIYYLNKFETLELDTTTRSLRYTKYKKDKINEILEIRLLNGHYYVILAKQNYTYKIIFNEDKVNKKKIKNKSDSITIKNSIYKVKEFTWKDK